jgi:predicted nucleic acid-binding Zn ribbon protein
MERNGLHQGPRKLDEILAQLMICRGYGQELAAAEFASAWRASVGERLSQGSVPGRVRRGVMEVTVKNSTIAQELTLNKQELLRNMRQRCPGRRFVDIRFRVGPVP